MSDRRKHAEGPILHVSGGHIARKIRQRPVKEVSIQARLRLFSPQPPPQAGWWQRGQTPDGHATAASWRDGRASSLRRRVAPPDRSRGGWTDFPVAPAPRGPPCRTSDIAYRNAAQRSPRAHGDTRGRACPSRAVPTGTACPDRQGAHSVDRVAACQCGSSGRSLAVAGLQSRSSLRWDRGDTPPDQAALCLPGSNVGAQTI
jgi:hypothetical protein